MEKISSAEIKEIEILKYRILVINKFIADKTGNDIMLKSFEESIKNRKKNLIFLKGLRQASRDMDMWLRDFSNEEKREIEKILFDKGLITENVESLVNSILKRGKINTEEEYQVIHDYIKDVAEQDNLFKKIEKMNQLLYEYEQSLK